MNLNFPVVKQMGERAILVQFEPEINEMLLEKLLFYKNRIEKYYIKEKVEVINTYNSLLISYMFNIEKVYDEILTIKHLLEEANIDKNIDSRLFHVPVCYDKEFGWDLEYVCLEKKLSIEEVIRLHTQPIYTVYFLGFLPGFLYLGGLYKRLQISRKIQPRLKVEKGSVGIGENQTGIYPKTGPGGWQIIGKSPVELFDKNKMPPTEITPGDKVKFFPILNSEYKEIQEAISKGGFQLRRENYGN